MLPLLVATLFAFCSKVTDHGSRRVQKLTSSGRQLSEGSGLTARCEANCDNIMFKTMRGNHIFDENLFWDGNSSHTHRAFRPTCALLKEEQSCSFQTVAGCHCDDASCCADERPTNILQTPYKKLWTRGRTLILFVGDGSCHYCANSVASLLEQIPCADAAIICQDKEGCPSLLNTTKKPYTERSYDHRVTYTNMSWEDLYDNGDSPARGIMPVVVYPWYVDSQSYNYAVVDEDGHFLSMDVLLEPNVLPNHGFYTTRNVTYLGYLYDDDYGDGSLRSPCRKQKPSLEMLWVVPVVFVAVAFLATLYRSVQLSISSKS